jgi:hypothetical protein
MRFVSTRTHGVLDYLVGLLLIVLPWALGFARGGAETWAPVALGGAVIAYSLLTDYELGVLRRIQMPVHLLLDAIGAIALAVSPWLLAFDQHVWAPHLAAGLLILVVAALSDTIPGYERRGEARARPG